MISNLKKKPYEPKSKIGWVHGTLTILLSILLSYLTMMLYSKFMLSDFGVKIIPSMIMTPILISFYAIWLLLSKTVYSCIIKTLLLAIPFTIILKVI